MPTATSFPETVIVIGAGIFGLSTALSIASRHPSTKITVIDRQTPPVEDGTSVDTTRCIRADYADPIYARLAAEAQRKIEQDEGLSKHYFKQGMSFIIDGKPGPALDIFEKGLANVKDSHAPGVIQEMRTTEDVYRRIHGKDANPVSQEALGREHKWNMGYCNMDDAFIDAKECVRVYYERCLAQPSITFECGVAVDRLAIEKSSSSETAEGSAANGGDRLQATGVILEDGRTLTADLTLVAAGAWSPKLVYLEGLVFSSAIEVAWLKLNQEEVERWKEMSITTNLSTGFNIFPPHNGEIKCLRRSAGYRNTVSIPHPEDISSGDEEEKKKKINVFLPRTTLTNPGDVIPADAEAALRDNLRELFPDLAGRAFDRTKLCWLSQTPSADFIIAPHPRIKGVHVATGGSAHAWKFLTIIGDKIVDSMEGTLEDELVKKWAWGGAASKGADGGSAHRMPGDPVEVADVIRSM